MSKSEGWQELPCIFCGMVAGTVPCAKVAEDAATFAFMDIDPGSDGHLLVIPKRHSADLVEISADDLAATHSQSHSPQPSVECR